MDWFSNQWPEMEPFREDRLNAQLNYNVLSLQTCIHYFEQFYFIYTTNDLNYQLGNSEKNNLINLIKSAIVEIPCEPGKQERFEMALQLYRRDLNWIQNELSKYRYLILVQMQERYNFENGVEDA